MALQLVRRKSILVDAPGGEGDLSLLHSYFTPSNKALRSLHACVPHSRFMALTSGGSFGILSANHHFRSIYFYYSPFVRITQELALATV